MKYSFSKDTLCCWRKSCIIKKKLSYKYGWAVKGAKVISVLNDFSQIIIVSMSCLDIGVVSEIEFPGEIFKNIKLHFLKFEPHIHKSLFHSIYQKWIFLFFFYTSKATLVYQMN